MSCNFDKRGSNLIFIISLPRTGSTLLQRILFSNPDVDSLAEPWIMLHPVYALKKQGITTEYHSLAAYKTLHELLSTVPEGKSLYFDAIRDMTSRIYKRLLEISGKNFFLDKTPRYYNIIPELYTIYPDAHYIFLLRNPLAVLSSIFKTWFDDNPVLLEKSYFKRDLFIGPQLMYEGMQILQGNALVIQYENLVSDPQNSIKNLCKKIGIEFSDEMITYGTYSKPEGSFGDPVSVSKYDTPVSINLNKWVDHLTSEKLIAYSEKYLEYLGRNCIEQMGYSYDDLKSKLCLSFRSNSDICF